jgi:hypothetical protein
VISLTLPQAEIHWVMHFKTHDNGISLFLPLYDITQFFSFLIENLFLGPLCRRPLRLVAPIKLSSCLGGGFPFPIFNKEMAQVIPIKPDEKGDKPHDQRKDDVEKQRSATASPLLLLLRHGELDLIPPLPIAGTKRARREKDC